MSVTELPVWSRIFIPCCKTLQVEAAMMHSGNLTELEFENGTP